MRTLPPVIWMLEVMIIFAVLYLWAAVFPTAPEDQAGLVFFGGLGLLLVGAAIAKQYQRPD